MSDKLADALRVRPSNHMYGVTHDMRGDPIVIEPKVVKVGIGLPKDRAVYVYVDLAKRWVVVTGWGKDVQRHRFEQRLEAQKFHREARAQAPERKYPEKLPFFTFNRVGADGSFEPDFDAIESHGPVPTEVDIIFVTDEPLTASYQYWTATERRCFGDGINALRLVALADTPDQKTLAGAAQKSGEKYFPIINGCWTRGCQYSKPTPRNDGKSEYPSACKPHGRLLFQLVNSPRLGGTAYFDTTAYKSIRQLFSCIQTFRRVTGNGIAEQGYVAGIPLKMVLRPYTVTHNSQRATQYGVSLEFRAESALALKQRLIEHGIQFRQAASLPAVKTLVSLPPAVELQKPPEYAAAIAAEFDGSEIEQPPPDLDEDFSDSSSDALDKCWDDDPGQNDQAKQKQQDTSAQSPPPTTSPSGQTATSDRKATAQEYGQFLQMCRMKGISEVSIMEKLGSLGYESAAEVTVKVLPELVRWASAWTNEKQKSLL